MEFLKRARPRFLVEKVDSNFRFDDLFCLQLTNTKHSLQIREYIDGSCAVVV